jgi:TRAP-type mannitol/chloroaromatic compound transport system permease small subunit
MRLLLGFSDAIDWLLALIARLIGWLFLVLVAVICFDIVTRKVGYQLPGFGSTPIQELEWHLHGALFMGWLGYAYVRNVHVRIDVFTSHRSPRTQAFIEVIGILIFALPYCLVGAWFAFGFAETSFLQNESSDAPNGLPHRWILKFCLFASFVLLNLAVVSVLIRRVAVLRGITDDMPRTGAVASQG